MAKRIISLLLCLMITCSIMACGSEQTGDPTETNSGSNTTPVDDNSPKSGVPSGTTFDGATVRILNGQYFERFLYLVNPDETTGDTVNDAVYNRNMAVADKLNVKFEFTDVVNGYNTSNPAATVMLQNSVLSGDQEWDIVHDVIYYTSRMLTKDLLYNLSDAPYIDTAQPWWNENYINSIHAFSDTRYILAGDISIGFLNQASAFFYNKALYEDYFGDPDEMYDLVFDGKWTMDKQYELCSQVWDDTNGSGKIDFEDTVGTARGYKVYMNHHAFYAAGGNVTSIDEDGKPFIDGLTDLNVAINDKLYKYVYENPGLCLDIPTAEESDFIREKKFSEGTMLFLESLLHSTDLLRDMKDDFGIIPYPKYDETIEGYRSQLHDQAATYVLPRVTSTVDMACAVLEEMAFQGYLTMMPEYYSVALKAKYVRDSDNDKAMQILDIIHDTAFVDFCRAYSTNSIGHIAHTCIMNMTPNYVSEYTKRLPAAQEKFDTLLEYFYK